MYALYQNSGDGSFNYATLTSGLGPITRTHSGWGVRFFDYDNDGWKDLLIAKGHDLDTIQLTSPNLRYREPMLLARNTGQGFVDVSVPERCSSKPGLLAAWRLATSITTDHWMPLLPPTMGPLIFFTTKRPPRTIGSRCDSSGTRAIEMGSARK
jgi:hypothetical protein